MAPCIISRCGTVALAGNVLLSSGVFVFPARNRDGHTNKATIFTRCTPSLAELKWQQKTGSEWLCDISFLWLRDNDFNAKHVVLQRNTRDCFIITLRTSFTARYESLTHKCKLKTLNIQLDLLSKL